MDSRQLEAFYPSHSSCLDHRFSSQSVQTFLSSEPHLVLVLPCLFLLPDSFPSHSSLHQRMCGLLLRKGEWRCAALNKAYPVRMIMKLFNRSNSLLSNESLVFVIATTLFCSEDKKINNKEVSFIVPAVASSESSDPTSYKNYNVSYFISIFIYNYHFNKPTSELSALKHLKNFTNSKWASFKRLWIISPPVFRASKPSCSMLLSPFSPGTHLPEGPGS